MNCPSCRTGNPAGARFCLNCGTPLTQRCTHCRAEVPVGARFCMNCGQPIPSRTPVDEARFVRLAAAAPGPLIEKVRAAADLTGERRTVTVLFADVVGSTALAAQTGDEAWAEIMNGAFDRITPTIYRYEGTIARILGDALWAFFGAPVAHEDDPTRAIRAALDLLEAAREYAVEVQREHGIEFAMRACLNTGPVIIGPIGDDLGYEFTTMDSTVNLAARLKFATKPMTALLTEHTHRFVSPFFDFQDRGETEVQDGDRPVRVYQVLGVKAEPGRLRGLASAGLQSPMVGRDAELATLLRLCDAVTAGLGRGALITGEPGLGKSRLIAEWRRAVEAHPFTSRPARWAEGHSLSYGRGLAYHLLIDLLRSLLGVPDFADEQETRAALLSVTSDMLGESAPEVYPFLGHLLLLELESHAQERLRAIEPQALPAQYANALRRLLQAMCTHQPVVLVLEDLHWADPSSIEILIKLLPLASSTPLLLCMVTRPDLDAPGWKLVTAAREVLGGSLTEINLAALSDMDSRQLVSNLLQIEALPEEMRALILAKAEGNPFFVEEVIRMLIDRGAIVRIGEGWGPGAEIDAVEIPDNLQGLLLARIDRLPEEVKHTLRVAAVIGRQFPVKVLVEVLEGRIP